MATSRLVVMIIIIVTMTIPANIMIITKTMIVVSESRDDSNYYKDWDDNDSYVILITIVQIMIIGILTEICSNW